MLVHRARSVRVCVRETKRAAGNNVSQIQANQLKKKNHLVEMISLSSYLKRVFRGAAVPLLRVDIR